MSAEFVTVKMPANGKLITHSNIHELKSEDIVCFSSQEYWHKFILENGGLFDKEAVLQAVLRSISPFDLVPVKYTVVGNDSYFLARNCAQAIEKFCLNLLLPIELRDPPGEIVMTIQTCSVPIDQYEMNMQAHLKKTIEKRYDENHKGFINLSAFHREPDLFEAFFCPLSKPRFLAYVLKVLQRIFTVTAIDLSNNDIEELDSLEILHEFPGLVSVDLSNNKIKDPKLSELLQRAVPALQELNLSGNPICSTFNTEMSYLNWIRDKNYAIRKLDGITLNYGFPNQQVYLCSERTWGIVNAFLMHYFTQYDSNREILEHSYDENAMFSMTCHQSPSQTVSEAVLDSYNQESVNLLKLRGKSQTGSLHKKKTDVINVLCKLPLTEHDPYSFKVDVLYYEEPIIVIVVSGIFKDFQDTPRVRSFGRTFALKRVGIEEFKITNDLFHITNASPEEVSGSFIHPRQRGDKSAQVVTKEEEQNFIKVVTKLTRMNESYSKKCLEDCNWDVKKALEVFLQNYEISKVPPDAFAKEYST